MIGESVINVKSGGGERLSTLSTEDCGVHRRLQLRVVQEPVGASQEFKLRHAGDGGERSLLADNR
jgi:hypothetical protein